MARHLCIVARDNSPLYGFLTIAFRERPPGADTLDVVLDRRRGDPLPTADRPAAHSDRRRHARVDDALRTSGYAIVAGPGGTPRASDEALIERAVSVLADVERRGPLALRFNQQRRAVGRALVRVAIGAVIVLAIAWVLTTLPTIGGLARVSEDLGRWTDAFVGGLEQAWATLTGGTVSTPIAQEPEGERSRPSEPAAPVASLPTTTPSLPAPSAPLLAEAVRAAPALPPVSTRRPPVAEPRPAPEPSRAAARVSAPLAAASPPAPRVAMVEPPRSVARDTAPRESFAREASLREPAPRESSEPGDTRSLAAFTGLPRVELSRQPSSSGNGIVYTVRLVDTGGRPVPGAQVWMRGQSGDGQARETRLDPVDPPGTYRSSPLPPNTLPPQLSVRVFFSNMRVEVPVDP